MLTNCDDDLFAASNRRLGVDFGWVVTAQQARGYKPRLANFELLFARVGATVTVPEPVECVRSVMT